VLKDKEQDRRSSREVKVGGSPGKAVDIHIGGLYYQVTDSSREGCDLGSL